MGKRIPFIAHVWYLALTAVLLGGHCLPQLLQHRCRWGVPGKEGREGLGQGWAKDSSLRFKPWGGVGRGGPLSSPPGHTSDVRLLS